MSPFQSQLSILQSVINNRYTLRGNFPDLHAEIVVNWRELLIIVLCVIIARYVPFQRHFYNNKKRLILYYVEFRPYQQLLS